MVTLKTDVSRVVVVFSIALAFVLLKVKACISSLFEFEKIVRPMLTTCPLVFLGSLMWRITVHYFVTSLQLCFGIITNNE